MGKEDVTTLYADSQLTVGNVTMNGPALLPFDDLDENEVQELMYNFITAFMKENLRKSSVKIIRKDSTGAVPEFPLEIILQIIEYLHPLDLYHLTQTSKYFRLILLTRRLSGMAWETALKSERRIPPCPPTMSPPSWVSLLFGPATCDRCLQRQAMPDFASCQRICSVCEINLITEYTVIWEAFEMKYPCASQSLYKILRCSLKSGQLSPVLFLIHFLISLPTCSDGTKYHPGWLENRENYIMNDLPIKIEQASLYLEAIELTPSAKKEYNAFLLKCEDENWRMRKVNSSFCLFSCCLTTTLQFVDICRRWCSAVYRHCWVEFVENRKNNFINLACKVLVRMGHQQQDLPRYYINTYLMRYFEKKRRARFSKKEFHSNFSGLEALANSAKEQRLERERAALRKSLQERVTSFYYDLVQRSVPPERWDYIPQGHNIHILHLPAVVRYIDTDYGLESNVPDLAVTDVDVVILDFTEALMMKTRQRLLHVLKMSHPSALLWEDDCGDKIEKLNLATAVFTHFLIGSSCPCHRSAPEILFGCEEAVRHGSCASIPLFRGGTTTCDSEADNFGFSKDAYNTVVLLLRLLKLDPHTTLARDLDSLNKRFVCISCPLKSDYPRRPEVWGRYTMDWRQCVSHFSGCYYSKDKPPRFALLTVEATESVLVQENDRYHAYGNRWLKNNTSPISQHSLTDVLNIYIFSIAQRHKVANPAEGVNYFYRRPLSRKYPTNVLEFPAGNPNRRCLLCQGPTRGRLWTSNALSAHQRYRQVFQLLSCVVLDSFGWTNTDLRHDYHHRHDLSTDESIEGVHWRSPSLIDCTTDELEG
ncbi:hypothetical protein CVT26_006364 [Gymnopilus dilepis]|uniref:F-box domain-containing protein n=1 Tax=Gymnopilus dilepis TaxID=231916 RepID=A0A409Y0N0_9AGAR|nr:hypothetical protein CVT26_006364 [Gymnopilus dilepis]